MSKWEKCKLGDLGIIVTGKTPSKNNPEDWGNEMPFITPSDYKDYRKKTYSSERKLSKEGIERLNNKILPSKSILVTCIGSDMGKVVMNAIPAITNQQINAIIPDNSKVDNDFLYYQLISLYEILRIYGGDGTAVPIVNKGDFETIVAEIPSLLEQKAISSVLSSIDNKIDLLHRQNKTLEAMAETLFRQWFVEEAKEDWKVKNIGNVLQTVLGGTPSTSKPEYWNGNIPWINSGEVNNFRILQGTKYITEFGLQKSNTKLLPKGTTVLAITGATLGQVSLLEIETCANQSVVGLIPNENLPKEYVFLWMKHKIKEIILNETGGAQPHINKNDINETEIVIPDEKSMKRGIEIINPMFKKITKNSFQILTLEKLRGTLLPKLMSGEVRVSYNES